MEESCGEWELVGQVINWGVECGGRLRRMGSGRSQRLWVVTLTVVILGTAISQTTTMAIPQRIVSVCPQLESLEWPKGVTLEHRDKLVSELAKRSSETGNPLSVACAQELVATGMLLSAESILVGLVQNRGLETRERGDLAVAIQRRQSELEALMKTSVLMGAKLEARPAVKWGQSFEEITLFLKFASRIDSPGCNDVTDQHEEITTVHGQMVLSVTGTCVLAGRPVKFVFDLPLFQEVQLGSLKTVSAGVGALILTVKKKRVGIWPQIWSKGFNKRGYPITIWWELSGSQFEKGMKEFRRLQRERDEEDSEGLWQDNPRRRTVDDDQGLVSRVLAVLRSAASWLGRLLL